MINYDFCYSPLSAIWNLVCLHNIVSSSHKNYSFKLTIEQISLLMIIALLTLALLRDRYRMAFWMQPCGFVSLSGSDVVQFPQYQYSVLPLNFKTSIFYLFIMIILNKSEAITTLPSSFSKSTCKFFITDKEKSLQKSNLSNYIPP